MISKVEMNGGQLPSIVTVPYFSGAPWDVEKLEPLSDLPIQTMRLPEGRDNIKEYADFVMEQVAGLDCYVLRFPNKPHLSPCDGEGGREYS
jgi:hypothetical protein